MDSTAVSRSPCPEIIIVGVDGHSFKIWRNTSIPSFLGILISHKIKSSLLELILETPSTPSIASIIS